MKRAIPAQARIWATVPSPALLDSRLRGNDRESSQSFLVTPLCCVTFFLAVMLELIWVLESIQELMLLSILKFEQQQALQRFLRHARNNNLDLADLLIASSARQQGCNHVLTFDKKAAQSELFTSLQ